MVSRGEVKKPSKLRQEIGILDRHPAQKVRFVLIGSTCETNNVVESTRECLLLSVGGVVSQCIARDDQRKYS